MAVQPLAGKVALITGASRGIGAAVALKLAQDGADLLLTARSEAALDEVRSTTLAAGATTVHTFPIDLADPAQLGQLAEDVKNRSNGRLDILVNNAGILPRAKRTENTSRSDWDLAMNINLTAPWFLSCRAKEMMADSDGGAIINVSSAAAFYPSVGLASYNVSKAALIMLTKVCALEWARDDIRVLGVAPGKVDTELVTDILAWSQRSGAEINPMRRVADPTEVADLVAFLVSSSARYVTGTVIPIDGGELLTSGR